MKIVSMVVLLLAAMVPGGAAFPVFLSAQQTAPRAADGQVQLMEVPQPDLSGVDPPAREQIRNAQAGLDQALAQHNSPAQKANAFGSLGQIYQAYGFYDTALVCYENAARLAPQSFRWQYYAGYLHQRTGEDEAAVHDYRKALTLEPGNTCAMLRLGNLELSLNQPDLAKSWFLKVTAQRTPSAAGLTGLGKIALIEHQYPAAVKYFTKALALEPKASSIHYQLAMAFRGLGDTQKMQENLQARGEIEPTIRDPLVDEIDILKQGKVGLLERGSAAMRENRLADAVASYRQMVRLYPSDPIAYKYLGVALARSGKSGEALEQDAHALQLDPTNATVHYDMGVLLIQTGKEEMAIAHFREAIRLDAGLTSAHFQLANLLMRRGKDKEAEAEYGIVVSLEPQNGFARLMQAMAAVHAGGYAEARSLLEEASTALPQDADIANALARVLAAAPDVAVRDENRALHIVEALVKNERGDEFEVGVTLGMALAGVGRFTEAAAYQRAMIQGLEGSGRPDLAQRLRKDLALYENHRPCRKPWASDDPIFTPVPNKAQFSAETKTMSAHP
jgi:tetratricopeptide (TPR) repeat protein